LSKYLNFDNERYYFNLRMMLNLFLDLRSINFHDEETLNLNFEKYYFNLGMMLNLFLDFRYINENYYFSLRMMSNLFLDLRNINYSDEQTLNFKCFIVNNINFTNIKEFIHCL
jgi:hypothetical protein